MKFPVRFCASKENLSPQLFVVSNTYESWINDNLNLSSIKSDAVTQSLKPAENMVRIQIELPEEQVKELDELMRDTKIGTRKELFNNALTLFQWAVKSKKAGRVIASVDERTQSAKELVMPSLENVAALDLATK